jgi:hypothetical protein
MDADLRKALILSDNDGLARAIELYLGKVKPMADGRWRIIRLAGLQNGRVDLIVLALSSPTSDPLLALIRASLLERVGQVPLLIISDRPFHSDPDAKIFYLEFPFDADRFSAQIDRVCQVVDCSHDVEMVPSSGERPAPGHPSTRAAVTGGPSWSPVDGGVEREA